MRDTIEARSLFPALAIVIPREAKSNRENRNANPAVLLRGGGLHGADIHANRANGSAGLFSPQLPSDCRVQYEESHGVVCSINLDRSF